MKNGLYFHLHFFLFLHNNSQKLKIFEKIKSKSITFPLGKIPVKQLHYGYKD